MNTITRGQSFDGVEDPAGVSANGPNFRGNVSGNIRTGTERGDDGKGEFFSGCQNFLAEKSLFFLESGHERIMKKETGKGKSGILHLLYSLPAKTVVHFRHEV